MKKIILSLTVLAVTTTLFAQKKAADVAKFANETIDLGKIKQSVPATATFTVTNIGNEPLIIEQASPTCGCTIGDYTKEPIAPGKTGTITATYNAAAATHFTKSLTVKFAGVDEVKSIMITGDVLTAEDFEKLKTEAAPAIVKAPAATSSVKSAKLKPAVTTKATPVKSVKAKKPVTTTKS
jgi:DNA-binding protein YbaB